MVAHVPQLAVLADYPQENWPSMDFCGEMLLQYLQQDFAKEVSATRICPTWRRRYAAIPLIGRKRFALNLDRLHNRYHRYPRHLRGLPPFDYYHVVDHSYAHLVHDLPAARTGVFCHDLDAFRSIIEPQRDPRPAWFQRIARNVLTGMQKAAVVFYTTDSIRDEILAHKLVDPNRLVKAPLGVAAEYTYQAPKDTPAVAPIAGPYLLHVGHCWQRKRVDVLLEVAGRLCREMPELRLVKVGGEFTPAHQQIIDRHGLRSRLVHRTGIPRQELAGLYRGAVATLMTSEAEGFGIPVIEALSCGSIVVASDLPVFREVGGAAVLYARVADLEAWTARVRSVIQSPAAAPSLDVRLAQAARFSWRNHAERILAAYRSLPAQ